MSDDRIYVRFKGKTLGPLADQKVRDLVRRGQITRMHELSSDGLAWQRAEEFGDFFVSVASRSASNAGNMASGSPTPGTPARAEQPRQNGAGSSMPIAGQSPDESVQWYANIDGDNQGPVTTGTLLQWIQSGGVTRQTLVWRAGFDDWRSAEACLGEHFASPSPMAGPGNFGVNVAGASRSRAEGVQGFVVSRAWTFALSILGFVWSGLGVIYFVTAMIVGADAKWVPFAGSRAVVYGLSGLILCGIFVAGSVLLLNCSSALKKLELHGDGVHLSLAAKRLHVFWRYAAIVMIIFSVFVIGGAVLLLVMTAAAADAVT